RTWNLPKAEAPRLPFGYSPRVPPDLPRAGAHACVALVTGACSGIGNAMAKKLGALGYELVLVSNRAEELAAAAEEIHRVHGVKVHTIPLDLARSEAAGELHGRVRSRGIEIDILINNAGMFFFGEAADAPLEKASRLIELHVMTPSLLSTCFGR